MTHIENILPEMVGSEVVGLSLRDADGLAAAALYDLVRKATGCRLPQPDGTPSSEVEEMLALCSAVLRRHWQAPLTMLDGLSLQDLVSRLMADRVEGNATLGIPAVNGSVTEALSALLERKITGAPEVADGMSLVRLFCDSAVPASLTTLTDPTTGWTMDKQIDNLGVVFPNLTHIVLGAEIIQNIYLSSKAASFVRVLELPYLKRAIRCCIDRGMMLQELNLPMLEIYQGGNSSTNGFLGMVNGDTTITKLYCPKMKEFYFGRLAQNCPELREVITDIEIYDESGGYLHMLPSCPNVEKIVFGNIKTWKMQEPQNGSGICSSVYLIHLEIAGAVVSLDFRSWSPTTALSSNLLQFLSNFREFICDRLADRTGSTTLTLTLSSAVYDAISADTEYGIMDALAAKNWTVASA